MCVLIFTIFIILRNSLEHVMVFFIKFVYLPKLFCDLFFCRKFL